MDEFAITPDLRARANRASGLIRENRLEEASVILESIVADAPNWLAARLENAGLLFSMRKTADGKAQLTAAAQLAGVEERAHFAIAAVYHNAGIQTAAERFMRRSLLLGPAHATAMAHLLDMLRRDGENVAASRLAGALVVVAPLSAQAHAVRAACLHSLGHFAEVTRASRRALLLDPGNASVYLYRAIAAAGLSEIEAAVTDANHAVMTQPNWPDAWLVLTGTLFGAGDFSGALGAARCAQDLGAEPAETHIWLGRVLLALHKNDEANRQFAAAERLDPSRDLTLKIAKLTMSRDDFRENQHE